MDYYQLVSSSSYQDSLNILDTDIQHANILAASLSRAKGGACVQMKLVYNQLAPIFMFLLQWFDCSCTCFLPSYLNLFHIVVYKVCPGEKLETSKSHGRRATVNEFYAVILPSLQHLNNNSLEIDTENDECESLKMIARKNPEEKRKHYSNVDIEREDECGICLEPCTKMVLPNCCHSMCINCYRDWNVRSESCPFCRRSLKRVKSGDLWVLTCNDDVIDQESVSKDDMFRFFMYINSLPKHSLPDSVFLVYSDYAN